MSAAARRSISVGCGAPPVQKNRRRRGVGGQNHFPKIHEKISFYSQNFLRNFLSHQSFEVCRWQMLAGSESDLQRMMDRLNMVSVNYNMKINTKKTKVLRVSKVSESDNVDSSCRGNYRTSQGILLLRKHDLQWCHREIKRRTATAASIWFEIWWVVDPGQQNFDFYRQISEKFQFFRQFYKRISSFAGKFPKILIFSTKKIRFSKQKIVHLQLPLAKLFYFPSKVITFEHTSCTW